MWTLSFVLAAVRARGGGGGARSRETDRSSGARRGSLIPRGRGMRSAPSRKRKKGRQGGPSEALQSVSAAHTAGARCAPVRRCGLDVRCAVRPDDRDSGSSGLPLKGDFAETVKRARRPDPLHVSRERAAVDPSSPAALGLRGMWLPRPPPPHRGVYLGCRRVIAGGVRLIHHPSAVDCAASLANPLAERDCEVRRVGRFLVCRPSSRSLSGSSCRC
jgi:hypothetical protein